VCTNSCVAFARAQICSDDVQGKAVLEVGACDVNGSVRPVVERLGPRLYIGTDLHDGPGVDEVCAAERLVERFGPEAFDLVVCTEMIEHVRDWRAVIRNLKQVLKPAGTLLLTTRSRGFHFHGYPFDYWRYEREDLAAIFSDFDVVALEPDPESPGVFLKAVKPKAYAENELAGYELYSIVTNRRVRTISPLALRWFLFEYRLARMLPAGVKQVIKRQLLRWHN